MSDEPQKPFSIIDHIYELHDKIEEDLVTLRKDRHNDLMYYPGIVEAVHFLHHHGFAGRLGLSTMDLSKFNRERGPVETATIEKVGNRVQAFLKEMEGEVRTMARDAPASAAPSQQADQDNDAVTAIAVHPVKWVITPRRQHGELIEKISSLLDEVAYLAKASNLPPDQAALTELQRAQLIALLETTLALLKGPLIEKGLLRRALEAAKDGAANSAKKHTELALGYGLGKLAESLLKLLNYL